MRYDAHALETNARVVKWPGQSLFWKHVPRAMNSLADRLANMSPDRGTVSMTLCSHCPMSHCPIASLHRCPSFQKSPLACSPISIVPMSHCPLTHGPLSDCPLSHGLFVLPNCPLHDCPSVLLFTGPSSPPSHGPIVPLPNVPLTIVRSSTVQVSHCPIVKCPIAAWSHCSLSHCPVVPLSIVPESIVRCEIVLCRQYPTVALACGAGDCRFESAGISFVFQSFASWHEWHLGET